MENVYFTFRPTDFGGTTDQLTQFSAWYKLGRSLGYKYVHRPIRCDRSSSRIFEFLGFDAIWETQEEFSGTNNSTLELALSSQQLRWHYGWGFRGLRWYVERAVGKGVRKEGCNTILVEFQLKDPGDRAIFLLIERAVPLLPDGIDLRQSYFRRREIEPIKSMFQGNGCKVLVHMRLGDATAVKTPWGTWLSVFSTSVAEFPALQSQLPDDASWNKMRAMRSLKTYIGPEKYLVFLKSFAKWMGIIPYSIVISSDGYRKTFQRICAAAGDLNLTEQQLNELHELEKSYEQSTFRGFQELRNIRMILGENDENLFHLIHTALTADIIVTSPQQLMMVKLLQLYGRVKNPPLLIVLCDDHTWSPDIGKRLGHKVDVVIYVKTDQIDKVMPSIIGVLTKKYSQCNNDIIHG